VLPIARTLAKEVILAMLAGSEGGRKDTFLNASLASVSVLQPPDNLQTNNFAACDLRSQQQMPVHQLKPYHMEQATH
jgi:hypothetical protein